MDAATIVTTARLLLELYGMDVVPGSPQEVDRFLAGARLLDKPTWRQVLLAAAELMPSHAWRLIH